jgi:hypothetical protein
MGYAEAKSVCERILAEAGRQAGVNPISPISPVLARDFLSVNQPAHPLVLCPTPRSATTDAHAKLMVSSAYLGALPSSLGSPSSVAWMPAEPLASVIVGPVNSLLSSAPSKGPALVYHPEDPKPVGYESLLPAIAARPNASRPAGSQIQIADHTAWLGCLRESATAEEVEPVKDPAIKPLAFCEFIDAARGESISGSRTEEAARCGKAIREMGPMAVELVEKWMQGRGFWAGIDAVVETANDNRPVAEGNGHLGEGGFD